MLVSERLEGPYGAVPELEAFYSARKARRYTITLRQSAADALVKIGAPAVDTLIAALGSRGAGVRYFAIESLAEIGDKRAVPALTERLSDPEWDVKLVSVFALLKLGDAQRLDLLVAGLDDANKEPHSVAAELLGKTGDSRAIGPLIASLQKTRTRKGYDEDLDVTNALVTLAHQRLGVKPKKWIDWWRRQGH